MQCPQCKEQRYFITASNGNMCLCRACGYFGKFQPPRYDSYHADFYSYVRVRTEQNDPLLCKIIETMDINKHHHVLDYGCGGGDYTFALSRRAHSIIGVDINVDVAKRRFPDVTFMKQEGDSLQFQSNYFDRIICVNTIEHVRDFCGLLQEFKRVLKPKGRVFITTYDTNFLLHKIQYDITHVYEWDYRGFKTFISHYFNVERAFKYGSFF